MSGDTIGLIVTAVICSVGATRWIVSALSDVTKALAVHTVDDAKTHKEIKDESKKIFDRVTSLEAWRKRGRK